MLGYLENHEQIKIKLVMKSFENTQVTDIEYKFGGIFYFFTAFQKLKEHYAADGIFRT
jgi:hypothetical protein